MERFENFVIQSLNSIQESLRSIRHSLWRVERKEDLMALAFQADLDALIATTTATEDAEDAAVTLLQKLFASQAELQAKLDAAIAAGDPAAIAAAQKQIQDATALLKTKTDALAAAIVANTPAA